MITREPDKSSSLCRLWFRVGGTRRFIRGPKSAITRGRRGFGESLTLVQWIL
jgi:hypothetical protein